MMRSCERGSRRAGALVLSLSLVLSSSLALLLSLGVRPARAQAQSTRPVAAAAGAGAVSGDDARRAYRAGQAAGDREQSRREYQRGITLARAALVRNPNDPGALLWLAANLGGEALTHGKLHALGVIGEIESTLLRLEQQSPNYDHAAGARALGRLYQKAPAIISVGSSKKAAAYLEKALARAPEFPGNLAFAADFYAERRDCGRALPLAQRLNATTNLDTYGFDAGEWRAIGARVLADCR
jgi:tetratricopeptide (TPR) repeat protein